MSNALSVRRPAIVDAGERERRRAVRMELPRVIVGHDGVDALVQIEDAEGAGRVEHAGHDVGAAAIVVRVGEAVGVAEFVQDHREGEAAPIQADLVARDVLGGEPGWSQPPLYTLKAPMPCCEPKAGSCG